MLDIGLGKLLELGGGIIDKFIPNAEANRKAKAELEATIKLNTHEIQKAQIEVNKESAKHSSVFVAGARPFILWVCGFALAYACMLRPLIFDIAMLSGSSFYMPELDDELLSTALFGLLGLGGLRTFEKSKKVARESL